ncbi:hypothetical protein [Thiorhodococcus minor]|uniref:Uncharacterized protein n=1 Tax=Thiorhodococcus minor TaxID=57489 RepID=A0A6M0K1F0_9GAMM|nr:hypothetical protein [Thiorhodococcus minor]NEV62723.1 hypothetical protein [Thiorhodococcus minor]
MALSLSRPTPFDRPLLLGLSLLLAATLPACGSVKKDKMAVTLQNATNGYRSALRWGYYENAYGFVDPEKRKDRDLPANLEGIRLTGYDVVQAPIAKKDSDTAMQIVNIEYLHEDRQVVKKLTDRQVWRYDEEAKKWWLESGLPTFE